MSKETATPKKQKTLGYIENGGIKALPHNLALDFKRNKAIYFLCIPQVSGPFFQEAFLASVSLSQAPSVCPMVSCVILIISLGILCSK